MRWSHIVRQFGVAIYFYLILRPPKAWLSRPSKAPERYPRIPRVLRDNCIGSTKRSPSILDPVNFWSKSADSWFFRLFEKHKGL